MRCRHLLAAGVAIAMAVPAAAVETKIMLRVRAADAKFIGSSVGGLKVVVTDARTGRLLDSGRITGGTGDTATLMSKPQSRGSSPASADSAGFVAMVDIDEPRKLRFNLTGPLGNPDALQQLSVTSWVVPGHNILGDGLVLQLPGLAVTAAQPEVDSGHWRLTANVTLMCGCPITANGLWKATAYEVHALLRRNGNPVAETPLTFTGHPDQFAGDLPIPAPGHYRLIVWAFNHQTGNTGASEQRVEVQ